MSKLCGIEVEGRVISYNGVAVRARVWPVRLYDLFVDPNHQSSKFLVTSFDGDQAILTPLSDKLDISSCSRVVRVNSGVVFKLSEKHVLHTPFGHEDGKIHVSVFDLDNHFTSKKPVVEFFRTGVKAVDWFLPFGKGQRGVIIANAGVGKSTLIRYLIKFAEYDVAVIGLIGERGREVAEFLSFVEEQSVGHKVKLVVSTSSETPVRRLLSCYSATQVASYYRKRGLNVLLIIDSLTRVARAIREIGFQGGELPVRQGLTPSVFTILPQILEVPGNTEKGSITAFYTLLTSDDHEKDVLSEEVKSLVDGHIILDRGLSQRGIYPAINLVHSLSRLKPKFQSEEAHALTERVKMHLKILEQDRELMYLANAVPPHLTRALRVEETVLAYVKQDLNEAYDSDAFSSFCLALKKGI
ncbi:MAG: hypothetical protein NZO16_01635 [Deltaproteobacteria bacterium]|nr:hypothetical protein [Deltaproteobacteria bacterium]